MITIPKFEFTDIERIWFSLPPRLGGLGLNIISEISPIYYSNSKQMTNKLVMQIINQHRDDQPEIVDSSPQVKSKIQAEKKEREERKMDFVKSKLNPNQLRVFEAITEKGASSWLTALPLKEHELYLNKQTFWDTIYLRYGIQLPRLPTSCVCGSNFTMEHALMCMKGGFVTIRHNELRDFTAELLSEICNDVAVEPLLTPCTGEKFQYKTANDKEGARVDVAARGVWVRGSKAYFDVRVFNPLAPSYSGQTLKTTHKNNEMSKKREYAERILKIEHGSFTPLVFSSLGGMSVECTHFYNRLADKISEKRNISVSKGRAWIRTKLSFSLLRSTNLCIRGSRTRTQFGPTAMADTNIEMALSMARIED